MSIITASAVSLYAPKITASAGTIISGNYIPVVQERIFYITNNYFTTDLEIQTTVTFNATANSITMPGSEKWENYGFKANDDIFIYGSYRNEGVKTISSLFDNILYLTSSCSCIDESFAYTTGPIIYFSVIQWPISIVQTAAKMIWYDCDYRDKNPSYIKSHSLGPLSESFGSSDVDDMYGYPIKILQTLDAFKIARFN